MNKFPTCCALLFYVTIYIEFKTNHHETTKDLETEIVVGYFVISSFRDFVIENLLLFPDKYGYFYHSK